MARMYVLSDKVVYREIEGEIILVPVSGTVDEMDSIYSAGGSGGRLLRLLANPRTEEELVADLLSAYRVEPERAREDVAHFLTELEGEGIIKAAEGGG